MNGTGFVGGGRDSDTEFVEGAVRDKRTPNTDGLMVASVTPRLAGPHVQSVTLVNAGVVLVMAAVTAAGEASGRARLRMPSRPSLRLAPGDGVEQRPALAGGSLRLGHEPRARRRRH